MIARGNEIDRLPLSALRPTQIAIGIDYVEAKALITARYRNADLERFLRDHAINVVLGPDHEPHIVDHHHWARACFNLGFSDAPVTVVADLSRLRHERFWQKMQANGWVHPFDGNGKRCQVNDLPLTIGDMIDDPYHILAAFARRAGAYRKPKPACGSFVWFDFLRAFRRRRDHRRPAAQARHEPHGPPRGQRRDRAGRGREHRRPLTRAVIIVVSNPLDEMTALTQLASNFPKQRVFGQAGVLDTARFTNNVATTLGVPVGSVTTLTLGLARRHDGAGALGLLRRRQAARRCDGRRRDRGAR